MKNLKRPKTNEEEYIRLALTFSRTMLLKIDHIREEWGLRSRSAVIERLLEELFSEEMIQESSEDKTAETASE